MVRIGPSGLGSVKDAVANLEEFSRLGLSCCELAFTYGVYIKSEQDAILIGKKANELGISLSIHAPYWINLNSSEKSKIEKSKYFLLDCLRVGSLLGATNVVFHAGFYGKDSREKAYETIRSNIVDVMGEAKKRGYSPKLAPETMGKVNVFGSIEEISSLVKDTGCGFCIDFAHILAREKDYCFERVASLFPQKKWHIHFSGIEYSEKGEKRHLKMKQSEWKELFSNLPAKKEFDIICESPDQVSDAVLGVTTFNSMFRQSVKK